MEVEVEERSGNGGGGAKDDELFHPWPTVLGMKVGYYRRFVHYSVRMAF